MKRILITSSLLLLSAFLIFFHYQKIMEFTNKADAMYDQTIEALENDNDEKIISNLDELKEVWDDVQGWVGLTVDATELEKIDVSLSQCMAYAKIDSKDVFLGEYVYFNHLVKQLSHYETFSLDSIF